MDIGLTDPTQTRHVSLAEIVAKEKTLRAPTGISTRGADV